MLTPWSVEIANTCGHLWYSAWHILGTPKPLIDTERFSILTWSFWEHPQVDGNSLMAQQDSNWESVIQSENIQSIKINRLCQKSKYKPLRMVPCLIYFQLCLK